LKVALVRLTCQMLIKTSLRMIILGYTD